jgi:hypothetical protein
MAMPDIGDDDVFESNYMALLEAELARHGLLIHYVKDRAGLDLGVHLYAHENGRTRASQVRVWLQAKGRRATSITAAQFEAASSVALPGLDLDMVRYWHAAPEPVYLVVYIESVDVFLAADVRELIDRLGSTAFLSRLSSQQTITLRVPKGATLDAAIERMPLHRSMRIDGPSFRGRPLGHNYDPLRSELQPLLAPEFIELVRALLDAHDYRTDERYELITSSSQGAAITLSMGVLYYTYEWILPMTTEFGYDADTDFRIEGDPFTAHGHVAVIVDTGPSGPAGLEQSLAEHVSAAKKRGVSQALVFLNCSEAELIKHFAAWRIALEPLECWPQAMGSLSFNVLVTTNVYLAFLDRLKWRHINYLN